MSLEDDRRIAWEMHRKLGSFKDAADALGLAESTVRGRVKAYCPPKPPSVDNHRIKALEAVVEQQQERIDNLTRSKFRLPKAAKGKTGKGTFARVIIPDTHGCYVDEAALSAFLYDLEQLAPTVTQVVWLGDHLDCGGFLAQHHTMGYVAETAYTFEDDVAATNQLLDRVQELCPKAEHHYLEGNHERRIEKFCVTQAVRNKTDAAYLHKLFSVESVLHLEKRGVNFYKQGQFYDGCAIPATIKLDHCHFTHGSRTNKHAASAMLNDFGANVVFGHTHRMDSHTTRKVADGIIGAWCPGALCRLQPLWNHTQITGWSHGYGLQTVDPNRGFLHVNVPIIDGKSYLIQLTERMA